MNSVPILSSNLKLMDTVRSCIICDDEIPVGEGTTLACMHSYDDVCLKDLIESLQKAGRPMKCAACDEKIPYEVVERFGGRVVKGNQIQCPVVGHNHLVDFTPGTSGKGNLTRCSFDPNRSFCASCRLAPYHYETESCDSAEKFRKEWDRLRSGISLYNFSVYPGPLSYRERRDPSTVPPSNYTSLSDARRYIVKHRARAVELLRGVPKNDDTERLINDLDTLELPRSRGTILMTIDYIDQIINGDPSKVSTGSSHGSDYQVDEAWKVENCRLCPRCARIINRTEGCADMVCGRDTHGQGPIGGCGLRFKWGEAHPYESPAIVTDIVIKQLMENETPVDMTLITLDDKQYERKCRICEQTREAMYLCTTLEPALIVCFPCLSASHGSIERLRIGKERVKKYTGLPVDKVLLPVNSTYTWIRT